jgi:2'-5' RNA ligase
MAEGRPLRLFVAIDVPDDVRDVVDHAVGPLRERFPTGRWVPVANQHVTVKFLGSTPPERVPVVLERVTEVASRHAPFTTRAARLGAFPSARRAKVLWVGLDDADGRSAEIAGDLDVALAPELAARDDRPFTPHLTIARFDPAVRLEEDVTELGVESRAFVVDRLTVYRSHLGGGAPRYEPLDTVRLAG